MNADFLRSPGRLSRCWTPTEPLTRAGRTVDVARVGLPVDTHFVLPVRGGGTVHGHFVLTAATRVVRPTREQLRIAAAMANQVAGALADDRARSRNHGSAS